MPTKDESLKQFIFAAPSTELLLEKLKKKASAEEMQELLRTLKDFEPSDTGIRDFGLILEKQADALSATARALDADQYFVQSMEHLLRARGAEEVEVQLDRARRTVNVTVSGRHYRDIIAETKAIEAKAGAFNAARKKALEAAAEKVLDVEAEPETNESTMPLSSAGRLQIGQRITALLGAGGVGLFAASIADHFGQPLLVSGTASLVVGVFGLFAGVRFFRPVA